MLQIISGKFFKSDDLRSHNGKGLTYTNFSCIGPIETCVATLEPLELPKSTVSPFLVTYTNQIEKDKVLVRVGDSEIVRQFECIATFGLKSLFGSERADIEFACRSESKGSSDRYVPQKFASDFFSHKTPQVAELPNEFANLVKKVIGLPRDRYVAVLASLENFRNALNVLSHNIDMAYSILVYCIESVSQQFDAYTPVWDDYDQATRSRLDPILDTLDAEKAAAIRLTLSNAGHLRLQKRFVEFAATHISDCFFVEEAASRDRALRPCELRRALRNTYQLRSRYVHLLKPIPDFLSKLQLPKEDVFAWYGEPYLTFSGLLRIAHHAIREFIWRAEFVETEDIDWRRHLPGTIQMRLSPEYWVWQTDNLQDDSASARFSGFLTMYQAWLTDGKPMTDLSALVLEYEKRLPQAKKPNRIRMVALYHVFNALAPLDKQSPEYHKVLKQQKQHLDICTIEMLIARWLVEPEVPWPLDECAKVIEEFQQRRFSKGAPEIPRRLELALMSEIANDYLREERLDEYDRWAERVYLEAAGMEDVQAEALKCRQQKEELDSVWIQSGRRASDEEA